jgi:cation/acetate symporter
MNYEFSWSAFAIFAFFVGVVLGLSFYLGRRARSTQGFFAAHGQIHWFINGVAFAGDYLSAASFLGICGMIAFYGYDGFLYSIGYLAGWVVALFVIAEPIKRLGKFTFADALDARFNSRSVKFTAAISTLVVSVFYLIPQMVGAGALIRPLLGFRYEVGVLLVGVVVIVIVVTAGMVSTTWVQFIKGSLLVIFCTILTVAILRRGVQVHPEPVGTNQVKFEPPREGYVLTSETPPKSGLVMRIRGGQRSGEPAGPLDFLKHVSESDIILWQLRREIHDGATVNVWFGPVLKGSDLLLPGGSPTFAGVRSQSLWKKLDFISLMLALFCGTASLPHILIRYYTVNDQASARKSTVVGNGSIGFFYILTI